MTTYRDQWYSAAQVLRAQAVKFEEIAQSALPRPGIMTTDDMKVAVCEYLLQVNRDHDPDGKGHHPFIPPTAINWLGDGIVDAILKATGK